MTTSGVEQKSSIFVTLGGVPLRFELEWPFHKSTSGADFHVIHGRAWLLEDSAAGLHADFAANFSQTIVEALPSLAPEHAESVIINGMRMAVDAGRVEFLKSGKRLPVEVSSRYLNFKTKQMRFLTANDQQITDFLKKKLYWLSWHAEQSPAPILMADSCDAQYLGASAEQLMEAAHQLESAGLCAIAGDSARATAAIAAESDAFHADLRQTLERAVAHFNRALTG